MILWLSNQMITFFSLISGLFMSIIYCLLHMGVRLGQRSILNRRRPRILEFSVQKKKFSHRAFSQLSPLLYSIAVNKVCTGGRQLPSAAITISQHGGLRCRYGKIFAVHANIKHTFWGLWFVYDRIPCMHLLNTVIWFTCRDFCS